MELISRGDMALSVALSDALRKTRVMTFFYWRKTNRYYWSAGLGWLSGPRWWALAR
jgi:hypothetical protein